MNNSPNLPTSRTKRTQARNILLGGTLTPIFVMTFWSFGALPHTSVHVSFPELGTLNFGVPLKFEMGGEGRKCGA